MESDTESNAEFEGQRRSLFGLAYRLLGSAAEAEDVVQDAFLRWHETDRATIQYPAAWLAKVVTNLCLTRLTSARARREQYVGPWLPEPVLTEDDALGPLETVEQRDSVSFAMLVLLERLTPAERAVFVLREAFGYGHRDIAEIMDLTEDNSRQIYRRARQRITEDGGRFRPDRQHQDQLVKRFLAAATSGDLTGLEELLAADVTSWADGGGQVPAARRPVSGGNRVARYVVGGLKKVTAMAGSFDCTYAEVNGDTAILAWHGGTLVGVAILATDGERIHAIQFVAAPAKLRFLNEQLSRSGAVASLH